MQNLSQMTLNNKLFSSIILVGIILSCLALVAFIQSPFNPPQDQTISLAEALALHKNYDASTGAVQARLEGIYLSREALNELVSMLATKPNAAGVRIYFGKDKHGASQNILVTTDQNKIDDTGFLLKAAGTVVPCPSVCDTESPFIKQ